MMVRVGDSAPDFVAKAFYIETTTEIHLSRYRGQWVVLLFFVGDFTIV